LQPPRLHHGQNPFHEATARFARTTKKGEVKP
jgi:hypothetical protein